MPYGEVAEWLNAAHSKCAMVQAIVGSNPTLSVVIKVLYRIKFNFAAN